MDRKNATEYSVCCRNRINVLINEYCDGVQQTFSEKTGIKKGSINQYVNGRNVPSNVNAKKIADAFNVNPAWVNGFPGECRPLDSFSHETGQTIKRIVDAIQDETFDVIWDADGDYGAISIYKNGEMLMPFRINDLVRIFNNASEHNDVVTVNMLLSDEYDVESQRMERDLKQQIVLANVTQDQEELLTVIAPFSDSQMKVLIDVAKQMLTDEQRKRLELYYHALNREE